MGNFYINVSVKGPTQDDLVSHLTKSGCRAYVSPTVDGVTAIVADQCDPMGGGDFLAFATEVSEALECPALLVMNHDDSILAYWLFECGTLRHEYNSAPGYFTGGDDDGPEGGDASALCAALGCPGDADAVEQALRRPGAEADDGFVFALDRHQAVLDALGVPSHAVGLGWSYAEADEFPVGTTQSDFVKI